MMAQMGRPPGTRKGKYSVKFRLKNGTTTEKFYDLANDRDREFDRLKRSRGNDLVWIRKKG